MMKRGLITCFTAVLVICAINSSHAQFPASVALLESRAPFETIIPSSGHKAAVTDFTTIFRNDIPIRAVRDFMKNHGTIPGVEWRPLKTGFAAYYTLNDIKTAVYYHKNGDFERKMQYYYEDKLSPAIRRQVKSVYYDFNICCITEVTSRGVTMYDVKIEDKTLWKTIRVLDGGLQVIAEYEKQR